MKMPKFAAFRAVTLIFAIALCLSACAKVEELSVTAVTDEDVSSLEKYKYLQHVDFLDSTCYDAIMNYAAAHPDVDVTWRVDLGGETYTNDTTELTLTSGSFTWEELTKKLAYLPELKRIELPETDLTAEQLAELQNTYGVTCDYTVNVLGTVYDKDETALDLSTMKPAQIDEAIDALARLPELTEVELMPESGNSRLDVTDVKELQDALPDVTFHYSFTLFGQTVSTTDTTVEYKNVEIGNEGEEEIRQALDIMKACTYFKLDDCGLDNETMAGIRDDYPDTKVVWRVHLVNDHFNMLTDEEVLRVTHHLNNNNSADLKYCTGVKHADFGHNPDLSDFGFLAYMTELETLICSGSSVRDISGLANCDHLVWVELCFCGYLEDISCLEGKETLKYLNISYTKVSDISALEDVPLERLNCMQTRVSTDAQEHFIEKHPDCLSVFTGKQPYGYGWRYNDYGYTFFEYYVNMRKLFRYDDTNYYGNHYDS